jgi:hypothetical protein
MLDDDKAMPLFRGAREEMFPASNPRPRHTRCRQWGTKSCGQTEVLGRQLWPAAGVAGKFLFMRSFPGVSRARLRPRIAAWSPPSFIAPRSYFLALPESGGLGGNPRDQTNAENSGSALIATGASANAVIMFDGRSPKKVSVRLIIASLGSASNHAAPPRRLVDQGLVGIPLK